MPRKATFPRDPKAQKAARVPVESGFVDILKENPMSEEMLNADGIARALDELVGVLNAVGRVRERGPAVPRGHDQD